MPQHQFLPPKVPRSREEMAQAVEQIEAMGFTVAGSWRREKPIVGDLDILIPPERDFGEAEDMCVAFFGYERARSGTMKSEGVSTYKGKPLLLNLWKVPVPSAWAGMLLFSTGPFDLNIMMRARAQGQDMKLSQYGLFSKDDERQIDSGDKEEEIFNQLGLRYLTPKERQTWRQLLFRPTEVNEAQVFVRSSDGVTDYRVTLRDGKAVECECVGFSYRHKCRHLEIAEQLQKETK